MASGEQPQDRSTSSNKRDPQEHSGLRDQLLGGEMGGRRSAMTLLAIERRVRGLLRASREAGAGAETSAVGYGTHSGGYLAALSDRETEEDRQNPSSTVTGPQIEQHANGWAELVPRNITTRAALFELLTEKYDLPFGKVPGIRSAFDVDDERFGAEVLRRTGRSPRDSLTGTLNRSTRVQWLWSGLAGRFERLSPTLLSFCIVLTGVLGAGLLAAPVALARFDPWAVVVLLGVPCVATYFAMSLMVDALVRTSARANSSGTLSGLAGEYLGPTAARAVGGSMVGVMATFLIAYTYGFGSVLGAVTPVPGWLWGCLLIVLIGWLMRRPSLDATVAVSVAIGGVNILLVLGLIGIGLLYANTENVSGGDSIFSDGRFQDDLGVMFGFGVAVFSGLVGLLNASKYVLPREPTGRSLRRGAGLALVAVLVLSIGFSVVVSGAAGRPALLEAQGTGIGPLATVAGLSVQILASVYAVLALGMAAAQHAIGTRNQFGQWFGRSGLQRLAPGPSLICLGLGVTFLAVEFDALTELFGLVGALLDPIAAFLVPALAALAARRRGSRSSTRAQPSARSKLLSVIVGAWCFVGLTLHALMIFDGPLLRGAALVALSFSIVISVRAWQTGRFHSVRHVEIEPSASENGLAELHLLEGERRLTLQGVLTKAGRNAPVELADGATIDLGGVTSMVMDLGTSERLRLHRPPSTPDGRSLREVSIVRPGGQPMVVEFAESAEVLIDLGSEPEELRIEWEPARAGRRAFPGSS